LIVGAGLVRGPQATKEIYMDGQDRQDKERADFRVQISRLLILHILSIHV
jgi:hypothetical protein